MKCLAMAILVGTLIAESANASGVPRPSVPQALPKPHLPQTPSASINPSVPGLGGVNSAVRDATDFAATKAKVRAKNPNATDEQIEAGTKFVIKRRQEDIKAFNDSKDQAKALENRVQKIRADQLRLLQAEKEAGRGGRFSKETFSDAMVLAPGVVWLMQPKRPPPPPPPPPRFGLW